MKRKSKFIFITLSVLLIIVFASWDSSTSSLRSGDYSILERLFDLVQKENQEVKTWIEDWNKLTEESNTYKREYKSLIRDNEEYYRDARSLANALKDDTLKTKAIAMIDESEQGYKKKAVAIKERIAKLDKREQQMLEHYTILKIYAS